MNICTDITNTYTPIIEKEINKALSLEAAARYIESNGISTLDDYDIIFKWEPVASLFYVQENNSIDFGSGKTRAAAFIDFIAKKRCYLL